MDEGQTSARPPKDKKHRRPSSSGGGRGEAKIIAIKEIKTHPTCVELLAVSEDMREDLIQEMELNGCYDSEPVVPGTWPGQEEPVLIDGHMHIRVPREAGITHVPFVPVPFEDEAPALQHAINLQVIRRSATDGMLYRLCERYDRLDARGGDRRSQEAKSSLQRGGVDSGRSKSAHRTANFLGCNFRKVEKIRKIVKDGTPEIRRAVQTDNMSINRAYNLIRGMQKAKKIGEGEPAASGVKLTKIVISRENLAELSELGGDVGVHVNKAIEEYLRRLKGRDGS